MPELPELDSAAVSRLSGDNYSKGATYFRDGAVSNSWRTASTLYGQVSGSAREPYEVSAGVRDDGAFWARCSCPAARRQSVCKHAAALLVAYAEKPGLFPLRDEPERPSEGKLKVESEAKRVRAPKADRRSLIAEGLEKAESLLVDLCSRGLLSVTAEQVETIGSLAEALEAHKLRRLARQVAEIGQAASLARPTGSGFDETRWARLLVDAWFVLAATRKALEKGEGADQAELEELVGKTWLEKDLRRAENLSLVELAYETLILSSGFRVETSYLLELGDGTLYTEKQITPLRLKDTPRKRSYSLPLRVASAGIYPGFPPLRVKLIDAREAPEGPEPWARVVDLAEVSLSALRQRLSQSTASLVAPQEVYSLFRPAGLLAEGDTLHLLDGEGKAVSLGGEHRACRYALRGALVQGSIEALFCRVRFAEDALVAEPMSALVRREEGSHHLARLTA